jgi:hypothetical protein
MSKARGFLRCAIAATAGLLTATIVRAAEGPELTLDASEADAVLAILKTRSTESDVRDADWQRLFTSEPFRRLEKRELSMGRAFPREGFREFVLSDELLARREALAATLAAWKRVDLAAAAERIVPYLPAEARIRATVYPVIKPKTNSFVFETETDPAIFLYLDPEQSAEEFANTVGHELHHVGLASLAVAYRERIATLPDDARQAASWIGAFGEGLAVLAAAGSPDVHPMRDFPEADRVRWDQDQDAFDQHLAQIDGFLTDLVSGGFARPEVADRVAFGFFGYRGPWYTVGWRMGALVERRFGRAVLLECMADPRQLLVRYNRAAAEANATGGAVPLPLWSEQLLAAVADPPSARGDRKLH